MLASFPMEITAVECPIQVQVILSSCMVKEGDLIGSSLYSSIQSFGIFRLSQLRKKQKKEQNLVQKDVFQSQSWIGNRALKEPLPQHEDSRSEGQKYSILFVFEGDDIEFTLFQFIKNLFFPIKIYYNQNSFIITRKIRNMINFPYNYGNIDLFDFFIYLP